jgi:hypothetical protein
MEEKNSEGSGFLGGKNLVIGVLVLILLAMAGYIIWATDMIHYVSKEKASQKALDYINSEMLGGKFKAEVSGNVETDNSIYQLYKFKIKIDGQEIPSYVYVTRNGSILFPESAVLKTATSTANQPITCDSVAKADQPVLEAFVVSNCPYGLQMQRVLAEIAKADATIVNNFKVEYIGAIENGKITSMHGDNEAKENLKQICIREEQKDKFFTYLSCYMKKGDTTTCLAETKIDQSKLNACVTDINKGLKYAQVDFANAGAYGVSGSPTLILNGEAVSESNFGGRTAQGIKSLVCCGFNTQPSICAQSLSADEAAVGFSEQYSGGASSGNSNCAPAQ